MARRNHNQENNMTENVAEVPAEAVEAKEEVEIDLTDFNEALGAALDAADPSTGEVPPTELAKVNEAYRELPGLKGKNAAREVIKEGMESAMLALQPVKALAHMKVRDGLSAGTKASAGKPGRKAKPVDPAAAWLQTGAALRIAIAVHTHGAPSIEGRNLEEEVAKLVEDAWEDVQKLVAWEAEEPAEGEEKSAAPEVSPLAKRGVAAARDRKTPGRKAGGPGYTGPRRSVKAHVEEAFAEVEVGEELTIGEISNFKSTVYGDEAGPGLSGRVSAHFTKGKSKHDNLQFVPANSDGPAKVRKVA